MVINITMLTFKKDLKNMMSKIFYITILISASLSFAHAQDSLFNGVISPKRKVPVQLDKSPGALGISPKVQQALRLIPNPPINIALFGIDRRSVEEQSNSDLIMILSVQQQSGKLKMLSIMRDTYVNIEGKGMDKINAAFAFGGPQLAIKTINQNFDLDIKDYINVDFYSAAKIVDALGGVEIDLKPAEIPELNKYLTELVNIGTMATATRVTNPGVQQLNGQQTVAYTRIRMVGHGDYERTERQRTVIVALFNKIKNGGQNMLPVFASQVLPNLETSMNNMAMFGLAGGILSAKNKAIEQARFPLDKQSTGKRVNNIWYLTTDLKVTTAALHNFIYNDVKPISKNR
jgi:LCP family protein required for cell wall assembly